MKRGISARALALWIGGLTLLMCAAWFYLASAYPDGLERIAMTLGFAGKSRAALSSPLADYQFPLPASPIVRKIVAALLGAALCFLAAFGLGRYAARKKIDD